MDCLLGIDIGTAGTKSALFSGNGTLVDSEYISYPLTYPREGWAEQNPDDWWNALAVTVRALVSRNKRAHTVSAMSLSTQGGCLILLDAGFHPLYPAVSWLDTRAEEISGQLKNMISEEDLYKTCGWANTNGLNLPMMIWFQKKNPDLFLRSRFFASTIDYLNYRLTGRFSIDYTNLAMTMLLDLDRRDLSERALAIAGITRERVPEIIPSGCAIGKVKSDTASELGLSGDVLLVSGAHDQYCANIGAGAVNAGDCVLSTGTAWVLTLTSDRLLFDENHVIHPCLHVLENKFGLLTSVPSGGNSLTWFRDTFLPGTDFDALSLKAKKVKAGCEGLIFIPRNVSKHGRGSFLNIDTVHTAAHFTRSVFEGVALSNRRYIEAFSRNGINIKRLIMIGGGAKSPVWQQIVADVSRIPITLPEQKEASCAGAAMLAAVGCGMYASLEEAAGYFTGKQVQIYPDKKNAALYEKVYQEFVTALEYL